MAGDSIVKLIGTQKALFHTNGINGTIDTPVAALLATGSSTTVSSMTFDFRNYPYGNNVYSHAIKVRFRCMVVTNAAALYLRVVRNGVLYSGTYAYNYGETYATDTVGTGTIIPLTGGANSGEYISCDIIMRYPNINVTSNNPIIETITSYSVNILSTIRVRKLYANVASVADNSTINGIYLNASSGSISNITYDVWEIV